EAFARDIRRPPPRRPRRVGRRRLDPPELPLGQPPDHDHGARPGGGRRHSIRRAMKITGIRVQLCHFPLPEPFSPSWLAGFPQASNGCAIYRVQTDEGIEGVSASPLIADEAKGMVNLLRATLTGRDPTQVEDLFKILRS